MKLSTWMANKIKKRFAIMRLSGENHVTFQTETQRPGYYLLRVTVGVYSTHPMAMGDVRVQCCRKKLAEPRPTYYSRKGRRQWPDGRTRHFSYNTLAEVAIWLEEVIAEALTAAYITDAYVNAGTPWPSPLAETTDDLRAAKLKLVYLTRRYQERMEYYDKDWDGDMAEGRADGIAWMIARYGDKKKYLARHTRDAKQMVEQQIERIKELTRQVRELERMEGAA